MFCPSCGNQIPDGAKICDYCGNLIPDYSPEQAPNVQVVSAPAAAKKFSFVALLKNKFFIGGVALAIVAALVIILINVVGPASGGYSANINDLYTVYTEDNDTAVIYNGNVLKTRIDGSINNTYANNDYSTVYLKNDSDEIYKLSGGNLTKVLEEVVYICGISDFGDTLYYIEDDTICSYNGKKTEIAEIDENNRFSSFVISPNGDSCAWTEIDKENDRKGYAYNGGKVTELGKLSTIISITDGGDLIYCTNSTGKLCYIQNLDSDNMESVRSCSWFFKLSADNRQILFYDSGKTYVYFPSLEEEIKVSTGSVSPLVPFNSYFSSNNFDNFIGVSGSSTYRFTRNGDEYDSFKIANSDITALSSDGKNIIYRDGSKAYKKSIVSEDADKITVAKYLNGIGGIDFDPNFNNIYSTDRDYALVYSNGTDDDIKVVFDSEEVSDLAVCENGVCTFIYDYSGGEGTLAYSANGGEKQKCSGLSSAASVSRSNCGKYIYAVTSDNELYISTDGKTFTNTKITLYN
ncbi:MAG: zinc ribbon domain-containing protein [Oscillospiraceae bacterium]|nr:zinc ribbon domain-containing protein [Oscillospiraceae bacterium]